jgi:hypothetical protein
MALDTKLIFLHIPKTGGMTVYDIFDRLYKKEEIYTIKIKNKRPDHQAFYDLPTEEKAKIKVMRGHMPFGFHQYLPEGFKYMTMLREPVSRMISHYSYILDRPNHYLYAPVSKMTLEQYMLSEVTHELDNGQTRSLSGIPHEVKVTEEHFEMARKNMEEKFILPGVLDYFDECLILWKEMLGWKYPTYYLVNVSKKKKQAKAQASPELKVKIAARNEFDTRLYQIAKKRLEELIAPQREHLNLEIAKLHQLSVPLKRYGQVKEFVKDLIGWESGIKKKR